MQRSVLLLYLQSYEIRERVICLQNKIRAAAYINRKRDPYGQSQKNYEYPGSI